MDDLPMIDEDLNALHGFLRRMDPNAPIEIGAFGCHASELLLVVEEALQAREWAKMDLENKRT
jgi:hypothetical protein